MRKKNKNNQQDVAAIIISSNIYLNQIKELMDKVLANNQTLMGRVQEENKLVIRGEADERTTTI